MNTGAWTSLGQESWESSTLVALLDWGRWEGVKYFPVFRPVYCGNLGSFLPTTSCGPTGAGSTTLQRSERARGATNNDRSTPNTVEVGAGRRQRAVLAQLRLDL